MLHGYLELKLAWEMFQKAPDALSEPERIRVDDIARKQDRIELRILASAEAAQVAVPPATLKQRVDEIRGRYASEDDLIRDLERIGLTETDLDKAVERDLRVEGVLEKVATAAEPVSAVDAEIYYRLHPDAFDRPEARRLRHILITFNGGNEKARAHTTLSKLRTTLGNAEAFAKAALRHSQCPTAMDGGLLGVIKRQQLYPELEPAAFALAQGAISDVVESPIGLHLLRCDEIFPSGMMPFEEVCSRIIERLADKRRQEAQRAWIKSLPTT